MNLYTLQKEINEKRLYQRLALDKIMLLRNSLEPKATCFKSISVQGTPQTRDMADVFYKIVELEKEVEQYEKELDVYKPILEEIENLLKEFNDTYQLIYFEYYIKGYTAEKIGLRHNYSRAQVYNIINKIDEELQSKTLDKIGK